MGGIISKCILSKSIRLVLLLLAIHAGMLAYSASWHSPTWNEPGHLAAGVSHWQLRRFELYRVNPPLVRMLATLPVLAAGVETDWSSFYEGPGARPVFAVGSDFVAANGERTLWLLSLARWACIPFSLLGAFVCYRWARDLFGAAAGVLACGLWCFSPNMLGHGALLATDVPAAAVGITACYAFWHWLRRPEWVSALLSGLLLGAAALVKTTLLIFYPLWPTLWLLYRVLARGDQPVRGWLREAVMLFVMAALSINLINLGYGFEGSFTKLEDFAFVSDMFAGERPEASTNRFDGTALGRMPVPLPKNYLLGIDVQRRDFEDYGTPSYLRGEFRKPGWWYYYLYALGVKVPLGTWALLLLAGAARFCRTFPRPRRADEVVLLLPAASILALVSSQNGFTQHMRYVFPVFPFAFVWISQAAKTVDFGKFKLGVGAAMALLWSVGSSLWVYPHSLSYFNEFAGGPKGGHAHLIGSNIDWGQDLLYLKDWMRKHPEAQPMHLETSAFYNPRDIGIDVFTGDEHTARARASTRSVEANSGPRPGWYAVSVNRLHTADGSLDYFSHHFQPVARAGYSIYIYHVTLNEARRVRRDLGLPELPPSVENRES